MVCPGSGRTSIEIYEQPMDDLGFTETCRDTIVQLYETMHCSSRHKHAHLKVRNLVKSFFFDITSIKFYVLLPHGFTGYDLIVV